MDRNERAERFSDSKQAHRTTAYAIRVDDQWFAGFGGTPGAEVTKLRHGLCEAKLIGGSAHQKVGDYLRRLRERGYRAQAVRVVLDEA